MKAIPFRGIYGLLGEWYLVLEKTWGNIGLQGTRLRIGLICGSILKIFRELN